MIKPFLVSFTPDFGHKTAYYTTLYHGFSEISIVLDIYLQFNNIAKKKARTVTCRPGWYHEFDTPPEKVTPCVLPQIIARKVGFVNCQKARFYSLKIALFDTLHGKNWTLYSAKQSKINGFVVLCNFSKRRARKNRKNIFQKGVDKRIWPWYNLQRKEAEHSLFSPCRKGEQVQI